MSQRTSLANILNLCESEIRAGRSQQAAKRLQAVQTARVPRDLRLPLANLCRRVGLIANGLKLLTVLVNRHRKDGGFATAAELAEYAALLERTGAVEEALLVLAEVDKVAAPIAHLFTAFCHFGRWDYARSIPSLERYLESPLAPYAKFVGQVNLASAWIAVEDSERALPLISSLIDEARRMDYRRILANCLEMRAQVHLHRRSFAEARLDLESARDLGREERTQDEFFVHKWMAVLTAVENSESAPLEAFRAEALRRREWESLREADLYLLKAHPDETRFDHLYFGTPSVAYRRRIEQAMGRRPEREFFRLGAKDGLVFDLRDGTIGGREILSAGKKTHQVLSILVRDLYRPLSLGGLFSELFPGEHFDIFSSPGRVHQNIFRARAWMKRAKFKAMIEESEGYALRLRPDFSVLIPRELERPETASVWLERLRLRYGGSFKTSEALSALDVSSATFKRWASWAIASGVLMRTGQTDTTRYTIVERKAA